IRNLYSAVKVRRLASATTSGSGRGGLGGWGATVLPAAVLRSVSLRSSSLRSAAGKTVGEAEDIPLFFTLIPVLALLSNYDRGNCLINVGTEGELWGNCAVSTSSAGCLVCVRKHRRWRRDPVSTCSSISASFSRNSLGWN